MVEDFLRVGKHLKTSEGSIYLLRIVRGKPFAIIEALVAKATWYGISLKERSSPQQWMTEEELSKEDVYEVLYGTRQPNKIATSKMKDLAKGYMYQCNLHRSHSAERE
ncbi:hypothetical protein SESBI_38696 [Sesbania bispinosa]|nr:hypothetical protein SESBI_38696 [Sesbania bispinosa]